MSIKKRDVIFTRGDFTAYAAVGGPSVELLEGLKFLDKEGGFTANTFDRKVLDFECVETDVSSIMDPILAFQPYDTSTIELGLRHAAGRLASRDSRLSMEVSVCDDMYSAEAFETPYYSEKYDRVGKTTKDNKVSVMPFMELVSLFTPEAIDKRISYLESTSFSGYIPYPGYNLVPDDFLEKPVLQMTEYRKGNDRSAATRKFLNNHVSEKTCVIFFAGGGGEVKTVGFKFSKIILLTTRDYDSRAVVQRKYARLLDSTEVSYCHYDGSYRDMCRLGPLSVLGIGALDLIEMTFIHNFFPELSNWAHYFGSSLGFYHLAGEIEVEIRTLPPRMEDFDEDSVMVSRLYLMRKDTSKPLYDSNRMEMIVYAHHCGYRDRVASTSPAKLDHSMDTAIVDYLGGEAVSDTRMRMFFCASQGQVSVHSTIEYMEGMVPNIYGNDGPRFFFPAVEMLTKELYQPYIFNSKGKKIKNIWNGEYQILKMKGVKYYINYDCHRLSVLEKIQRMKEAGYLVLEPSVDPFYCSYRIGVHSTRVQDVVYKDLLTHFDPFEILKFQLGQTKTDYNTVLLEGVSYSRLSHSLVVDSKGRFEYTFDPPEIKFPSTRVLEKLVGMSYRSCEPYLVLGHGSRITMGEGSPISFDEVFGTFPPLIRECVRDSLFDYIFL